VDDHGVGKRFLGNEAQKLPSQPVTFLKLRINPTELALNYFLQKEE